MARPFERFERSVFCHFRKYQVQLITLVEQNSQASPCKNVCVLLVLGRKKANLFSNLFSINEI